MHSVTDINALEDAYIPNEIETFFGMCPFGKDE